MRLWSLHPSYLDAKGLVAAWREGLLARAVLLGKTAGYLYHPQLERFRAHPAPLSAINSYLRGLYIEANRRRYRFDRSKFGPVRNRAMIRVTSGQLQFEMRHLAKKLRSRSPDEMKRLTRLKEIKPHPMFSIRPGPREPWERGAT